MAFLSRLRAGGALHSLFPDWGMVVMGKRLIIGMILAVAVAATPLLAQDNNDRGRQILEALRDRIVEEIEGVEAAEETTQPGEATLIDFEAIRSRDGRTPVTLDNQYEQSHGVRFGKGVSVHRCSGAYDEFSTSLCPYPRGASGERAAMFDVQTGGAAMNIDFREPVDSISVRINPSGGSERSQFLAQAVGLDANGARIAADSISLAYNQNNLNWPYSLTLEGDGPIARVQIAVTTQAASLATARTQSQPVRFFIDDLAFSRRVEPRTPPVAAALAAQDGPPRVGRAVVVQSPRVGPAQSSLRLYPAAVRKRLAIDWDAVDAALTDQDALGLSAVAPNGAGQGFVDRAELPLLLPRAGTASGLQIFGNVDTVNAVWRDDGRDYSVYGSRLATVIRKADGASGVQSAITFSGTEDELTASFSLFGASYTLTQHCIGGASSDPACYDRAALGEIAESLVVVVGDAGRARP